MPDFVSGARTVQHDQDRHILDLARGLDFLNPRQDGIALAKKIGLNHSPVASWKPEWTETRLARRREEAESGGIDDSQDTITVADASEYTEGELLRVNDEVMRVTSIDDSTTVGVERGAADTTAAAHSAGDDIVRMGTALEENSTANTAVSDGTERLYNLVQTFDRPVELSTHAIAQLQTEEGNPMQGQLKRRYIEVVQQLTAAFFYGVRYEDTSNNRYFLGGLKHFIETHVTDVGNDLDEDALDDQIKSIVDAGGSPHVIAVNTTQKLKLDKLDNERVRTGKMERTGGGSIAQSWQSGLLDYPLEIVVDHTINDDELWILDTGRVGIHPMSNNGAGHSFRMIDATQPGQDGQKQRILGHYTVKVESEKAHGFLHNLST